MRRERRVAILRDAGAGESFELASPGIGLFRVTVRGGAIVRGGDRIGTLSVVGREIDVIVPERGGGEVEAVLFEDRVEGVEYGQLLLTLSRATSREWIAENEGSASSSAPGGTANGDPEDGIIVRAPTAGVFYRGPNTSSPPYVEVGSKVVPGQTLGLVEVMKCFNPIRFQGEQGAEVVEIHVEDGAEVMSDQVLFRLK